MNNNQFEEEQQQQEEEEKSELQISRQISERELLPTPPRTLRYM